jgi:hypothetical protein
MNLGFGYSRGVPEDITTAWGARLIAPNDLLHDRQDLKAESDEAKQELIAWLNGEPSGQGAISRALKALSEQASELRYREGEFTVYEDEDGIVVGNTQQSGGYVYVAGWLKPDRLSAEARERLTEIRRMTEIGRTHEDLKQGWYELIRGAIPAERWEKAYGWTAEQAASMDNSSTEVRLFHVATDGTRREIGENVDVGYEFGYGGTGPHVSAAAIVRDVAGEGSDAARLRELVPEVFGRDAGHDDERVVIRAADVAARLREAAAA